MHVALHRKRRGGKQSPLCVSLEASLIRHRHDIGDHAAAGNKAAPGRAGRADADGDFGIGLREDHAGDFHITVSGLVRHRGKAGAACRRRNALIHEGRLRGGHGRRLRAICGAAGKKACRKAKRGRQSDPFFHRLFSLVLCHWPARVPGPPGSRRSRRASARPIPQSSSSPSIARPQSPVSDKCGAGHRSETAIFTQPLPPPGTGESHWKATIGLLLALPESKTGMRDMGEPVN